MRKKFYFFDSFRDTIKLIDDPMLKAKYMEAIIDYGITGEYDTSDEIVNALMVQTKFTLNRSQEISESASERGQKGGAPKGNKNACKNLENISKQPKTSKNKLKQTKTSEEEGEGEGEIRKEKVQKEKLDIENMISKRNEVKEISTKHGKVQGLKQCRGPTEDMRREWSKVIKSYTAEEISLGVANYIDEIKQRNPESDYSNHRFTLYEFIKQGNGLRKFINNT